MLALHPCISVHFYPRTKSLPLQILCCLLHQRHSNLPQFESRSLTCMWERKSHMHHTYTYQIIQQYAHYSIQESRSHNYWSGKEVSLVNRSKLGAVVAAADHSKLRGDHCNHHFWPTYRNGLWRQKMAEAEPEKSVRQKNYWQISSNFRMRPELVVTGTVVPRLI